MATGTSARRTDEDLTRRRAAVPTLRYAEHLPVSQHRDELLAAIDANQVVIVAGETGSGKTTQLPKLCLELGRGVQGMIGHTQPRRLAARTVADRIAHELDVELGGAVGYAVRFTDRVGENTLVKLMTDGILLAEIHRDRSLRAYDTIIIDEAHERSLNIDFLLGYLKRLLPRRPDLKVIVTSATIETDRFSDHFDGAPVIEVSGRTFPVELRYRPVEDVDQPQAICEAVQELAAEGRGDILVFLSGEREIRDAATALADLGLRDTEVLPLYARLPTADQHRVFAPHRGRRIVLATNVAETSLTVPGIRYVVDPGTARISRYSQRLKVQRLPIEPVSQASANQRAGRCGREAPGVCIRLYDEAAFEARPAFTEPEILRTHLASVILQMTALGLGDIEAFPFLDPPDRRSITDGMRLLHELGALESTDPPRLTPVGRQLARLPVDPRFGRMVVEAHGTGCLREVLVIASGLSIEDPRERPSDRADVADAFHARFADDTSDFLALLNLWRYLRERQRELGSSQFRKLCRSEHINHLRVREWQDVHSQLRQIAGDLGMHPNRAVPEPDTISRAILAGLLSHIGMRDRETREFRGARNSRFAIFPGSALAKRPPRWVMAAELVETSRLWARTAAQIQPEWAEELAPHLVKHSHTDPHWSAERGAAMAYESVSLYGLPIVTRRLVGLGAIDPAAARALFIRHALVDGEWTTHHRFFQHNSAVRAEAEATEHRFRRRDLLVNDDAVFEFYDTRVGTSVTSSRHFDSWWKRVRRRKPDLLTLRLDDLLGDTDDLDPSQFPDTWVKGDLELPLTYTHDPLSAADGITVHIPLAVLNRLQPHDFAWLVPGLRGDLVTGLIRSLPKSLRRSLLPVSEFTAATLARLEADPPQNGDDLLDRLGRELSTLGGVDIPRDAWRPATLPSHLRPTFVITDDKGEVRGDGDDLADLQLALTPEVRRTIAAAGSHLERDGLRSWTIGELPRRVEQASGGRTVVGYPALVDAGDTVAVRVCESVAEQADTMWAGTRRLLEITAGIRRKGLQTRVAERAGLALTASPYPTAAALADDCVAAALDALLTDAGGPAWDEVGFERLARRARAEVEPAALQLADRAVEVLRLAATIDHRVTEPTGPALSPALDDVAAQRLALLPGGFVSASGADRLTDIVRYLTAALARLDALGKNPSRDRDRMAQVHRVEAAYGLAIDRSRSDHSAEVELERIGWMIEELRVSLFAQQLGAKGPVSEQRIMRAIAALP